MYHNHTRKLPTCDDCSAFFKPLEEREKNFLGTLRQQNFLAESLIYWIVQFFMSISLIVLSVVEKRKTDEELPALVTGLLPVVV